MRRLLLLLILMMPIAASATTGRELLNLCEESPAQGRCMMVFYISGFLDGWLTHEAKFEGYYPQLGEICVSPNFPPDITVGQLEGIFVKYLEENQDKGHEDSSLLFRWAMMEAFPCAEEQ